MTFPPRPPRSGPVLLGLLLLWLLFPSAVQAQGSQNHRPVAPDTVRQAQRARSPTGALLRSLVFPGWGQWYNGKKIKAVVALTVETALIARIVVANNQLHKAKTEAERFRLEDRRNLTFWWLGGTTLLSMLDAYVDAYLSDFDAGPDLSARVMPASDGSEGIVLAVRFRF